MKDHMCNCISDTEANVIVFKNEFDSTHYSNIDTF